MKTRYRNIEDRLFSYVRKTPSCWIWIGDKYGSGYGRLSVGGGKQVRAHRFIYEQMHGKIPDGMKVLHSCDTPACINPAHLSVGTQKDNVADMMKKGRGGYKAFYGEDHGNSKLTWEKVDRMRELWDQGNIGQYKLADMFNISQQVVSKVVNNKAWKKRPE